MRPLLAALAAAALAACDGGTEDRTPPPAESIRFKVVEHPHWRLRPQVPEAWIDGYKAMGENAHTLLFLGPEDDGHPAQVQVGWIESRKTFAQWADAKIRALSAEASVTVYDRGEIQVAGMRAKYLVYGRDIRDARTGRDRPIRQIDFYFAGHGHIGLIRGESTARTFAAYRALFTAIALRTTYEA